MQPLMPLATVNNHSKMQIKSLFVNDVNVMTVRPQKTSRQLPTPLSYCATTPHQQAKKAPIVSLQSLE